MALFVFLAAFFDLMDGMIARLLHVSSAIGKELDSLADMISFGLLPGLVMMTLLQESDLQKWTNGNVALSWLIYFPLLITAFSALRLAKFNIDTRQQLEFIGLPTPANTLWIISLPIVLKKMPGEFDFLILNAPLLLCMTVLSCYLMVAEIPLFSFKMKGFSIRKYSFQYMLILFALVTFFVISFAAIPLIVAFYVLLSIFRNFKKQSVQ